jgi:hypothetical protein
MADNAPNTIIVRFDGGQWIASFEHVPQVAFGGGLPMQAVRRLLEGSEAVPGIYELRCASDQAGSGDLHRSLDWHPPEILFECSTCRGTGQYVGLIEVGVCEVCGGRKVVAG